ncbi:MAG TPA: hypothetical protein VIY86_03565, partial [Pirellulaceae bacterium]
ATAPVRPVERAALETTVTDLERTGIRHLEVFALAEPSAPLPGLPDDRRDRSTTNPEQDRHETSSGTRGFYPHELRQTAAWLEDLADSRHMQVVWLPPHARANDDSIDELARRGPRAGGDVSVRVDRNGEVIPPRGPWRSTGNLLLDDWSTIWNDTAFQRYRGRIHGNTRCRECPGMAICAADCPSEPISWVLP